MADSDDITTTVDASFNPEVLDEPVRSIVQDELESGGYGEGGYGDGEYGGGGDGSDLADRVSELSEKVDALDSAVESKADASTVTDLQVSVETLASRTADAEKAAKAAASEQDVAALEDRLAALETGGGGSGDGGDVEYPDDLTEQIRQVMVDTYGEDLEAALGRILLPAREIGPSPAGAYHGASMWGIDFEVERAAHLGDANVDAQEAGTFEAVLGTFDGDRFELIESREIEVEQGVNSVTLDFDVPEAGRYLLTRRGNFALRRVEWGGWDSSSRGGMTLRGGAKPGNFDPNSYFYYYFNLEIAATADAH